VPVNCAALPESILEAELFGYERGAFTGAIQRHDGRFLQADRGTLFLDEIGEIPTHVQVKLLRVLQEGEVERLGGRTTKVDLRLVAATNQDSAARREGGRFREDLYLPAERDRHAHPAPARAPRRHPPLAEHFLRLYGERNGRHLAGLSRAAAEALLRYDWPGNVRELENTIERAVVLSRGAAVELEDLPVEVRSGTGGVHRRQEPDLRSGHAARRDRAPGHPRDAAPRGRRQAPVRAAARHRDADDLPAPGGGERVRSRRSDPPGSCRPAVEPPGTGRPKTAGGDRSARGRLPSGKPPRLRTR
jgi:transcriptional regulator with GAF, ATPase, and Fis domain